jgi:hypothetical protein
MKWAQNMGTDNHNILRFSYLLNGISLPSVPACTVNYYSVHVTVICSTFLNTPRMGKFQEGPGFSIWAGIRSRGEVRPTIEEIRKPNS